MTSLVRVIFEMPCKEKWLDRLPQLLDLPSPTPLEIQQDWSVKARDKTAEADPQPAKGHGIAVLRMGRRPRQPRQ